jgi:translation initiation factor 4G
VAWPHVSPCEHTVTDLGIESGLGKSPVIKFQMGQILSSASEEPSPVASANRSESVSGGQLGGRPPTATVRTISQGGTSGRDWIRGANASNRASVVSNPGTTLQMSNMDAPIGPAAPLEVSANHRVAGSARSGSSGQAGDSPEVVVDRVVKALLNSLPTHFDSISDQIVAWANKSEKEKDGRTLMQVIKLVFKKAADEVTFSEMYARLCRKIMWQISPKVQHDGLKNSEGKPFAGGTLFRVYLLHRCQEDLEQSWVAKEATAAAAASKAKRRRLGLIRFFGELFKLQILTERLIHECIKKLLGNVENPDEEEIESLCKLLTTVGSLLDTPKAQAHLDVYFSRMRELTKNKNVNTRMVFMLQVCIYIPCAYVIH